MGWRKNGKREREEEEKEYVTVLTFLALPELPSLCPLLLPSFLPFPFWAAAPKGPMTYAFTQGKFLLLLLLLLLLLRTSTPFEAHILALRLISQP